MDGAGGDIPVPRVDTLRSAVIISTGRQYLVHQVEENVSHMRLYAQRLSGDTTVIPIADAVADAVQSRASFSPDGKWLSYTSDEGGTSQIYVRPFPDAHRGQYQVSVTLGSNSIFSGDGKRLFFINKKRELYVVDVDTRNGIRSSVPRKAYSSTEYTASVVGSFGVDYTGDRLLLVHQRKARPGEYVMVQNFAQQVRQVVGQK